MSMNLSDGIRKVILEKPAALNDEVLLRAALYDYIGGASKDIDGVRVFISLNKHLMIIDDIKNNKDNNRDFYKSKLYKFKKMSSKQYEYYVDEIFKGFGYEAPAKNIIPNIIPKPIIPNKKNNKQKNIVATNKIKKPQPLKILRSYKFSVRIKTFVIWAILMGALICANEFGVLYGLKHISYNSNLNVGLSILSVIMMLILSFIVIGLSIEFYILALQDYYENPGIACYEVKHLPKLFATYFGIRLIIFLSVNKAIYNRYYAPLLIITIVYTIAILLSGFLRTIYDLNVKQNYMYFYYSNSVNLMMIIHLIIIITLTSLMSVWACYVICFGSIAILLGLIYYEVMAVEW